MKKLLLSVVLIAQLHADDKWALTDIEKGWNSPELVQLYFHNSEPQRVWAYGAISLVRFRGDEKILDFGCGDGKLSVLLASLVPDGEVTAVDVSKEMIHFAKTIFPSVAYPNLNYQNLTTTDFSDKGFEKYNLITSFSVFHLVPDAEVILRQFKERLLLGGKLVMTIPIGNNHSFLQAALDEMKKRGLKMPAATGSIATMRSPTKIQELLEEIGFHVETLKVVYTPNIFGCKQELIDWFEGTCTANWDIPPKIRKQFFIDMVDRYLELTSQPNDNESPVSCFLERVDLVATLH